MQENTIKSFVTVWLIISLISRINVKFSQISTVIKYVLEYFHKLHRFPCSKLEFWLLRFLSKKHGCVRKLSLLLSGYKDWSASSQSINQIKFIFLNQAIFVNRLDYVFSSSNFNHLYFIRFQMGFYLFMFKAN